MRVTSVNVGKRTTFGSVVTGIFKAPVDGPVMVGRLGLEGDAVVSEKHHGGPDQAVYLYGGDDYAWWEAELGRQLEPGTFGENLTVEGLESAAFSVGDILTIGGAILQVTAPRIPCGTFARRMELDGWIERFRAASRPGLYCRVLTPGPVSMGEVVGWEPYAGETLTIVEMFANFYAKTLDEATLRRMLAAPIAARSRAIAERQLGELLNSR